jgi:hypothetical protein
MDQETMVRTAALLFGLSAVGGFVMAVMRFRGIPTPPASFAMGHGVVAAAGLTLLVYATVMGSVSRLTQISTILFALAAVGGAGMQLMFHSKQLPLPIPWVIVHGLVAVCAFGLLLVSL